MLSETLTGSATAAPGTNARVIFDLLQPFGASAARFFLNGVDMRTRGVDVVAHYKLNTDDLGDFDFTAAANHNIIKVTKTPVTEQTTCPHLLFARQAVLRARTCTPQNKVTLQPTGQALAHASLSFYGMSPGTNTDGSADLHRQAASGT